MRNLLEYPESKSVNYSKFQLSKHLPLSRSATRQYLKSFCNNFRVFSCGTESCATYIRYKYHKLSNDNNSAKNTENDHKVGIYGNSWM